MTIETFRMCLLCHRNASSSRLLCPTCQIKVDRHRRKNWVRFENGVPTLALYNWRESSYSAMQRMAQALKGGGTSKIFETLAVDILNLREQVYPPLHRNQNLVFVPAPGLSKNYRDHAEELAAHLAALSGGQFVRNLSRASSTQQKRKSLMARAAGRRFKLQSQVIDSEVKIVFVDDILTSGSTARSAYKALNKPKDFEIWTLFYRPLLLRQR